MSRRESCSVQIIPIPSLMTGCPGLLAGWLVGWWVSSPVHVASTVAAAAAAVLNLIIHCQLPFLHFALGKFTFATYKT